MATSLATSELLDSVSDVSLFINSNGASNLSHDLARLTKAMYEFGQRDKSYKISNKKSRNLSENLLVTKGFGSDELWAQIRDHSQKVVSNVDQRAQYRKHEHDRMQLILGQLQNEENVEMEPDVLSPESDVTPPHCLDDVDDGIMEEEAAEKEIEDEFLKDDGMEVHEASDGQQEEEVADWVDVLRGRKKKKSEGDDKKKAKSTESESEKGQEFEIEKFDEKADEIEAFIDAQWKAEDEAFDVDQMGMMERALALEDEEQEERTKGEGATDNKEEKERKEQEDDFAFLDRHIASDDEAKGDKERTEDDAWNDLFNLPKFESKDVKETYGPQCDGQQKSQSEMKEMEEKGLSRFEIEERAIKRRIKKLEEENVAPRSWELQGEVSNNRETHPAARRPRDSLLSTYIDFDYSDKLKPAVTDDLNQVLETLIITKIKNNDFDDVEQKRDFVKAPNVAKRKLVEIQDTKNSMGLAELYEREYLQQIEDKQAEEGDEFTSKKDAELQKKHEQISRMKATLFYELDQLIRFHYEPRPAVLGDNIKVKTHTKALHMEEALPFASSTGDTLAPEQLYRKPRKLGHIKGESEMTREDRRNKRSANKKRAKHWKNVRNQRDTLRAAYDEKFNKHLNRIKSLNEVRTHAMAAAKNDADRAGLNMERDETRYTSSRQLFAQIMDNETTAQENSKEQLRDKTSLTQAFANPRKKRKVMQMGGF